MKYVLSICLMMSVCLAHTADVRFLFPPVSTGTAALPVVGDVDGDGVQEVILPTATGWQANTVSTSGLTPGVSYGASPTFPVLTLPRSAPWVVGVVAGATTDSMAVFNGATGVQTGIVDLGYLISRGNNIGSVGLNGGGVVSAQAVQIDPDSDFEILATTYIDSFLTVNGFPLPTAVSLPVRFLFDISSVGVPTLIRTDIFATEQIPGFPVQIDVSSWAIVLDADQDGNGTVFAPESDGSLRTQTWNGSGWTAGYSLGANTRFPTGLLDPRGFVTSQVNGVDVRTLPVQLGTSVNFIDPTTGVTQSSVSVLADVITVSLLGADYNGDGFTDVAVTGATTVNGNTVQRAQLVSSSGLIATHVANQEEFFWPFTTDLNGNGTAELALGRSDQSFQYLEYVNDSALSVIFTTAANRFVGPFASNLQTNGGTYPVVAGSFGPTGTFLIGSGLGTKTGTNSVQLWDINGAQGPGDTIPAPVASLFQVGPFPGGVQQAVAVLATTLAADDSTITDVYFGLLIVDTPAPLDRTIIISSPGSPLGWTPDFSGGSVSTTNGTTTAEGLDKTQDHTFSPVTALPDSDG